MANNTELHSKYTHCIEMMILNAKVGLPFYGEFNLHVNFHSKPNDPQIKTAGVNVTSKGINHYYNPAFLDSLTQLQINFLMIHETFHVLFNHQARTRMGGYDHKLSNITQDMIINQLIVQDIKPDFIDIPKDEFGRNTALFIPKDYEGEWVFEVLYDYNKERKEEFEKRREKKEDNKIFAELFVQKNRPTPVEVTPSYTGQDVLFTSILEEKSKNEYEKYMKNFTRKVLVTLSQNAELTLIGHASSIIPNGEAIDYNQTLSERRAEMFKNAIIENIDMYIDTYALCMAILESEKKSLSDAQKLDYIIKYEEIINKTAIKAREVQLRKPTKDGVSRIESLFAEYRFAELDKNDEATLKLLIQSKSLQVPNIAQEKAKYVGIAQNKIKTEGKGDSEPIITNELDSNPSILRNEIVSLPQYATLKNLTDPEQKQMVNRRIEYKFPESQDDNMGGGSGSDSENQGNRGGYGKNGQNGQESFSMDDIFENMDENNGQFMDNHIGDEIPEELREQMVNDIQEKLKARGFVSGEIEKTLERLQKKKKDYLKEIKRGVSFIKGHVKVDTLTRPNRKGVKGLKGKKKLGAKINCILDTSGSMGNYFEKALSFIFRNDIEVNLIMCDTEVKSVDNIKSMKDLKKVIIKGLGGTTIQPAFDLVVEKYNNLNTLLISDGFTDNLHLSKLKGKVLIISNSQECPIASSNGKVKQIIVKDE